ncbi:MAG: hypothetical protein JO001_21130 [Alphaproteobacteria bacterium]|nr:hypothetical protein [Alphaproteobacteria bacterium]
MIFFLITLPGPFADWCSVLLAKLAEAAGGGVVARAWPTTAGLTAYAPAGSLGTTLDQLGQVLVESDAEHVVFAARQPDAGLLRALQAPEARFLVAIDDPTHAVAAIIAETGENPKRAVRAIANSCALFTQFAQLPGAMLLQARGAAEPAQVRQTIDAIVAHLGIHLTAAARTAVTQSPELREAAPRTPVEAPLLAPGIAKMMIGALGGYGGLFQGGRLSDIVWTRDLFLMVGDRSLTEPVELTGGSRILVFGPYIHLIPGSWRAKVVLGFSDEAAGSVFIVDTYADERQLAAVSMQPAVGGLHTAELSFSVPRFTSMGIELRVHVTNDQTKGHMAFGQVTLTPLSLHYDGAEVPRGEDFRTALEM